MDRREFIEGIGLLAVMSGGGLVGVAIYRDYERAAGAARRRTKRVYVLYGDGIHDDTEALQAACDGEPFVWRGRLYDREDDWLVSGGQFRLSRTLYVNRAEQIGRQRRQGSIMGNVFDWNGTNSSGLAFAISRGTP